MPDSGRFTFLFAGSPAGSETFTIARDGDGFVAHAIGAIQVGSSFAFADTLRLLLDREVQPLDLTSRALVNGRRSFAHLVFEPGHALAGTDPAFPDATPDTTFCAEGAVLVPNNFLVGFQLAYMAAARRGLATGDITLPLYGSSTLTIERGVRETRGVLRTTRYAFSMARTVGGNVWIDDRGRVVKLALPLQNAEIVRDGIAGAATLGDTVRVETASDAHGYWGEEVKLLSAGTPLGGTLLLPARAPASPVAAVLLLTGSGAQDRNEDTPGKGGIHFGIFRLIAERLAARGIATLRLDDRGVGASGGDFNTSTFSDGVGDARTALRYLRGQPAIDARRVAVLGHSEGAAIAMLLAAEDSSLAGAALLAGPIQRFRDVIMQQTLDAARNAGQTPEQLRETARVESSFIAVLERRGEWTAETVPPQAMHLLSRRVWLEELVALDLVPAVQAIRCPVGIFQGARDEQVRPHDAAVIDSLLAAAGTARHALHVYPRLNHLFIESRGGGIAEYARSDARVDETFLRELAAWMAETLTPRATRRQR